MDLLSAGLLLRVLRAAGSERSSFEGGSSIRGLAAAWGIALLAAARCVRWLSLAWSSGPGGGAALGWAPGVQALWVGRWAPHPSIIRLAMATPGSMGFEDAVARARREFPPRDLDVRWPVGATPPIGRCPDRASAGTALVPVSTQGQVQEDGSGSFTGAGSVPQSRRERSRSLHRPLRRGAPVRLPRARGRFPSLDSAEERAAALAEFHGDVYAQSSRESLGFKWRTVERAFASWGAAPFPPTVPKISMLGAVLKAGGYRSAPGYLSLYRTSAARLGHTIGPEMATAFRDAARSCGRGLGAPVRATPLPLLQLHRLSSSRSPWAPGGPCSPRNAVVAGSWWMLREVELATVRARLVTIGRTVTGERQVFLTLPASKTDQAAHGVARGHRCRCSQLPARTGCPACSVMDQMEFLRRQFPASWRDGRPSWSLPLFPRLDGQAGEKEAFVATIVHAAGQLQVALTDADASTRVSGHSLRVTGAQGLTRMGFPLWAVQLLGRWGSDTVKSYVGAAALDVFSETAPEPLPAASVDLQTFLHPDPQAGPRPTATDGASPVARADVEKMVAARAGDLRAELLDALLSELRLEVARRVPPAPVSADRASSTCSPLVRNSRTKCLHICAVAPESGKPPAEWTSLCGWDFGRWGGFTIEGGPLSRATCDRCRKFAGLRPLAEVGV